MLARSAPATTPPATTPSVPPTLASVPAAPPGVEATADATPGDSRGGSAVGRAAKRALDIAVSGSLLVVLSPSLVLLAAAIKGTSSGPVIFRQERIGRNGETFKINKFRTMAANNDDGEHRQYIEKMMAADETSDSAGVHKLADARVTRVGSVLRRYSLDELPQLWNVLQGSMSLVGPRPSLPWEHELFTPEQQRRVRVTPGCSGLWQTSGRNLLTIPQMIELDNEYIDRWSFWGDVKILLATPFAILRGDGAR